MDSELDEILENYKAWLLGNNERQKTWLIKAEAKQRLQAVISRAVVDELKRLDSAQAAMFGHGKFVLYEYINKRIAEVEAGQPERGQKNE